MRDRLPSCIIPFSSVVFSSVFSFLHGLDVCREDRSIISHLQISIFFQCLLRSLTMCSRFLYSNVKQYKFSQNNDK